MKNVRSSCNLDLDLSQSRAAILRGAKLRGRIIMDEEVWMNQMNRASNRALHKLAVSFTAIQTFARLA